jgi:transposase
MLSLGIDVAKATLHCALLRPDDRIRHKRLANSPAGFQALSAWLARHTADPVHACLEATGPYGDAIALYLYDAGHRVSVLNPAVIHAYAKTQQLRAKTDPVDAALIARYAAKEQPAPWVPPPRELRELQALVRRIDALHGMHTQEANRLTVATDAIVRESIKTLLAALDAQLTDLKQRVRTHLDQHPGLRAQRDLLLTIPGIGETTAAVLIAELFHKPYRNARQAAAFAGTTPRVLESGQWRGHATLSRCGPALVRKALYFPALTALRYNPTIAAVRVRLAAKGKPKMVIVGAAIRHLIHVAFGVLKSQRAYDPSVARA